MPDPNVKTRTKTKTKTARPPLFKVILLNDDYTPREFVVQVLKAVFRMGAERAQAVMMTAHQARRLRDRGLYPRRRRDQGEGGDRSRQAERLSAVLHDRAGDVTSRHPVIP